MTTPPDRPADSVCDKCGQPTWRNEDGQDVTADGEARCPKPVGYDIWHWQQKRLYSEDDKPYSGAAPIERGPFPGMVWP